MRLPAISVWRRAAQVLLALLLVSPLMHGAWARPHALSRLSAAVATEPVRLMVQLKSVPLADVAGAAQEARLKAEQSDFRDELRRAGIEYQELSAHHKLFNGLTIQVKAADALRIGGLRGVAGVFVSRQTQGPAPMLKSSTRMIGAHKAWAGDPANAIPGVDGKGITVAIIDTGVSLPYRT